jgi:transcriptional regulator with XRE-family HTH domain
VLLGWTQQTLADHALVALNTVSAIETDRPYPKPETLQAVRHALQKEGIMFLSEGTMGEGVRLTRPRTEKGR